MKVIDINIQKQEVYESIKNISAYMASKMVDANGQLMYDKIAIFDEDNTVLDNLWKMSCRELERIYNRYVNSTGYNGTYTLFRLSVPENTKTNIGTILSDNSVNFMSYCMLAKWCDISNREDSKIYEDSMQVSASSIKEALYDRTTYSRLAILNKTSWK